MKKLTLLFALILLNSLVFGQNYAFKVLANKGNNEVKSGETWQPIKTGSVLQTSDELKVADNGYLGLVHQSGKPVELKKSGSYKVKELADGASGGTSVLHKYTDFILSSNSAEAKKNRLSATGAVHRGDDGMPIKLMLPENQHSGLYNNTAVLNWDDSKTPGPFIITVKNIFDEEVKKLETDGNTIEIDLTQPEYATLDAIQVEIASKSDPTKTSRQHLIKKLQPAEQDKVRKSLSEIIGVVAEQTALNKLILAGFYEDNHLFIDAITAYEEAIKLAPDVPSYEEAYEEFLLRHGLKRP